VRRALVHRSPLPDAALVFCDRLIAFDHRERRVHLLALADAGGATADAWLAATERALATLAASRRRRPPAGPPGTLRFALREAPRGLPGQHRRLPARDLRGRELRDLPDHRAAQRRAIDPLAAYRALRARNPAPFAALLRLGDVSVLSSSPERFLRVDRERVVESRR
jgi:para-aminobenzoate synthetase